MLPGSPPGELQSRYTLFEAIEAFSYAVSPYRSGLRLHINSSTCMEISWREDARLLVSFAVAPLTLFLILCIKRRDTSKYASLVVLAASGESTRVTVSFVHQITTSPSGILILLAAPLNELGRKEWRRVASQNYFDPNGVFISTFWSAPLGLVFLLATVSIFVAAHTILIMEIPRLRL